MWLPIILLCSAPYIESCNIITGLELLESKEECFKEVEAKATFLLRNPTIYRAKPACQIVPEKIKKMQEKKIDI